MSPPTGAVQAPVRTLLGRGSLYAIGTAVQLSSNVLVIPAITRLLGPGDYGLVAAALIATQLLAIVVGAGMPAAITRAFFVGDHGPARARSLVVVTVALAAGMALLADLTGPAWSQALSSLDYGGPLRLAVWSAVPLALVSAAQGVLRAANQVQRFLVTAVLASAGAQGLGLLLVAAFDLGPEGYLLGLLLGYTAAGLVGLLTIAPNLSAFSDRSAVRSALAVGLPTVPHSLALYVLAAGDRFVIERYRGLVEVGRYQVAYLLGSLAISFLVALHSSWAPLIYGETEDRRWATLAETSAAVHRLGALVAGAIALVAPLALLVAAPASYEPLRLAPVTSVVAFALLPYVGYYSNALIVFQQGRTGVLVWVTPLTAAANITLNLALVPRIGIMGSAWATVVAVALQAALLGRAGRRMAPVPWRRGEATRSWLVAGTIVAVAEVLPTSPVWLGVRVLGAAGLGAVLVLQARRLVGR